MYGPLEMWGPWHLPTLPPSKSGTVCDICDTYVTKLHNAHTHKQIKLNTC